MNRITRGGRQYIDGVPVSKSVFGRDPEPVTKDLVKDIIRLQSEIPVIETHGEARRARGKRESWCTTQQPRRISGELERI